MAKLQKIALINVFWDRDTNVARYFSSEEEQTTYFASLTSGNFTPLLNFNAGDNIQTTITYRDTSGRDFQTLLKCNYAVVEFYNNDELEQTRYYFADVQIDSSYQVIATLELDDIQTNFIAKENSFESCLIRRGFVDRFIKNSDGTLSFNGAVDSKLFEREPVQDVAKRLVSREKLSIKFCEQGNGTVAEMNAVNNWYNTNVLGWVYVYLSEKSDGYTVKNRNATSQTNTATIPLCRKQPFKNNTPNLATTRDLESVCRVLCYPLYNENVGNNGGKIVINDSVGTFLVPSVTGLEGFRKLNNDNSYVVSMKFSIMPPFTVFAQQCQFVEGEGNLYLINGTPQDYEFGIYGTSAYGLSFEFSNAGGINNNYGLIVVSDMLNYVEMLPVDFSNYLTFKKSEIVGVQKNPALNPKLLGSDYFELAVTNERGDIFKYDMQKLNANEVTFLYSEMLTPDVTRSYLRTKTSEGVYIEETNENLTGLVSGADMSLMVDNDQLAQMLANNKNYYLQNTLNALSGGVGGGVAGAIIGSIIPVVGTIIGAMIGAGVSLGATLINNSLTTDNMRNAPNEIKNSNGNAYFNMSYTYPGVYVEIYQILPNEQEIVNDFMCLNGYALNYIDNVSNYTNNRKYYNYIECEFENIDLNISNEEKRRLRDRFKRGVMFLNNNAQNFGLENYENSLEVDNG